MGMDSYFIFKCFGEKTIEYLKANYVGIWAKNLDAARKVCYEYTGEYGEYTHNPPKDQSIGYLY